MGGLIDGYGELPPDGPERIVLYRVYHALELWDWFKSIGTHESLDAIAADLEALTGRPPAGMSRNS